MLVVVSDLHWRDEAEWTTNPVMTEGFLVKSLSPQVRDAMRSVSALGTGSTKSSDRPVAMAGAVRFTSVSP